tara:strand:+ start:116 stop:340 length:225 start_codon:yes stop_codon:yes gene_type:complete
MPEKNSMPEPCPIMTTRLSVEGELDGMTVARLRELLDRCPDDAMIEIEDSDGYADAPGEPTHLVVVIPTTKDNS